MNNPGQGSSGSYAPVPSIDNYSLASINAYVNGTLKLGRNC
jgi:hypothetical protein